MFFAERSDGDSSKRDDISSDVAIELELPRNAINLTPMPTTCRVFYLPDEDKIVKVGRFVQRHEAETLKFVKARTSVPVPEVYDVYEKTQIIYIFMSKVEGKTLASVWDKLSDEAAAKVASQLKKYIHEWQSLTSEFYGNVAGGPCGEIFFGHNSMRSPDQTNPTYGPYSSREEYNAGLLEALTNSRPWGMRDKRQERVEETIRALNDEKKVFSHGDLHTGNIMVSDSGDVTGILDWATACFSIEGREYFEMKDRAMTDRWSHAIDTMFSDDEKKNYEALCTIDRELRYYSGI
ncbi:hypothetical protein ABW21_db0200973 [Orbilia brochopaga]|nr:hypothetical protein ABW21_db0200973 [Drechslerella brochopaga]